MNINLICSKMYLKKKVGGASFIALAYSWPPSSEFSSDKLCIKRQAKNWRALLKYHGSMRFEWPTLQAYLQSLKISWVQLKMGSFTRRR